MQHINRENLYAYVLDERSLSDEEMFHLSNCPLCQREIQSIAVLEHELRVAQSSQPSSKAREIYLSIFQEYGPSRRGVLERARNWITATLVSDSRMQPLPSGTRSVRADSYRLLYDSPRADIELFIEGDGRSRRLRGDVMLLESETSAENEPSARGLLVQLQDYDSLDVLFETVADEEGGFSFDTVPTGEYTLLITASTIDLLEIDELNIT